MGPSWFSNTAWVVSARSLSPQRSALPKLMAKWRQFKRRQQRDICWKETPSLRTWYITSLLMSEPCWQSPISGVDFYQASVHARSPSAAPSEAELGRHIHVHSATPWVSPPRDCRSHATPECSTQAFFVFTEHLLRKEKGVFPKPMFYFPISLLDLNLAYLLT